MTDTSPRIGSAGLPPSNLIAGNTYNPAAGANFPPGTPVIQSSAVDKTVIPGRANDEDTSQLTGLSVGPGINGEPGFVQFAGVLTLTEAQWDEVTGGSGGLTRGVPYYLSSTTAGRLTETAPSAGGTFVAQIGVALSPNDLLILLCAPAAN